MNLSTCQALLIFMVIFLIAGAFFAVLMIKTQESELERVNDAYVECMNKKGW